MSGEKTTGKGKETLETLPGHVSGQCNKPMSRPAHALTFEQVVEQLTSDADYGLATAEAKRRVEEYGRNELGDSEGVSPVKIMVAQVANAMTLVSSFTWDAVTSFHRREQHSR